MPKILQLISSSGFFGADNVMIELSKQLQHNDFSPLIGVFKNLHNPHLEVAAEAQKQKLPVKIFPCKGRFDMNTIFSIRKFMEEHGIHIIHTHGYKSNLYALAASIGKKVSLVATCHNWLGEQAKMKFYARLDKFFLSRFDKVVAVSGKLQDEILNQNISPAKVFIINNGIDLERFQNGADPNKIKRDFNIDNGLTIIGTIGRLSEEKAHHHLLTAAEMILKSNPKIVFLIVGDGPLRKTLENESLKITKRIGWTGAGGLASPFIFTGVRKDIPAIYSMIDIYVLPSLTEGLPMVMLEAMGSEKPVIATRVGAVPKVVDHQSSGLLIEPGDAAALADAILELLDNPQMAKQLATNARRKIEQEFSSKKMAEKYIEVYQSL